MHSWVPIVSRGVAGYGSPPKILLYKCVKLPHARALPHKCLWLRKIYIFFFFYCCCVFGDTGCGFRNDLSFACLVIFPLTSRARKLTAAMTKQRRPLPDASPCAPHGQPRPGCLAALMAAPASTVQDVEARRQRAGPACIARSSDPGVADPRSSIAPQNSLRLRIAIGATGTSSRTERVRNFRQIKTRIAIGPRCVLMDAAWMRVIDLNLSPSSRETRRQHRSPYLRFECNPRQSERFAACT